MLFSNQVLFTGFLVREKAPLAVLGDITPLVGFVLAGLIYWVLFLAFKPKVGGPIAEEPDVIIGVDAADSVA